jgi:hypothetical protein
MERCVLCVGLATNERGVKGDINTQSRKLVVKHFAQGTGSSNATTGSPENPLSLPGDPGRVTQARSSDSLNNN